MILGFGGVNLGSARAGRSTRHDVRLVHEALDLGVTVFDTADAYGSGASERILGRALRGRRDGVRLATKGGYVFRERTAAEQTARRLAGAARRRLPQRRDGGGGQHGGDAYRERDLSPRHLRYAVEGSLRRLRTDHVDLYQLHGPPAVQPNLFDELDGLRASGKVGAFGIGAESVRAAIEWLAVPAVACVQIPFGVLDPDAAESLFPLLDERPVEVWARGVLGGGLLALAARDPASAANDPKAALVAALTGVAADAGVGVDELAITFARSFPEVSVILVGVSSSAHLRRNVEVMTAPPLADDVRQAVVALTDRSGSGRS
jgi:aryl-alcohol dehydrogenase-like predicted oxidoreductase